MVVNGTKPDLTGLSPINVIPAAKGQRYIPNCVVDFRKMGVSGDFWFIDDGYTDTSDEFVYESLSTAGADGNLQDTVLYQVMLRCESAGSSFFMWHGNHNTHLNLNKVTGFEDLVQLLVRYARAFQDANIFYQNPKNQALAN